MKKSKSSRTKAFLASGEPNDDDIQYYSYTKNYADVRIANRKNVLKVLNSFFLSRPQKSKRNKVKLKNLTDITADADDDADMGESDKAKGKPLVTPDTPAKMDIDQSKTNSPDLGQDTKRRLFKTSKEEAKEEKKRRDLGDYLERQRKVKQTVRDAFRKRAPGVLSQLGKRRTTAYAIGYMGGYTGKYNKKRKSRYKKRSYTSEKFNRYKRNYRKPLRLY